MSDIYCLLCEQDHTRANMPYGKYSMVFDKYSMMGSPKGVKNLIKGGVTADCVNNVII